MFFTTDKYWLNGSSEVTKWTLACTKSFEISDMKVVFTKADILCIGSVLTQNDPIYEITRNTIRWCSPGTDRNHIQNNYSVQGWSFEKVVCKLYRTKIVDFFPGASPLDPANALCVAFGDDTFSSHPVHDAWQVSLTCLELLEKLIFRHEFCTKVVPSQMFSTYSEI